MKKPHLIHLLWAIVAIAAFVAGTKSGSSDRANNPTAKRNDENSNPSLSSRTTDDGKDDSSRSRSKSSRNGGIDQAPPLSEAEVRQLGLDLKSAKGPLERRDIFSKILANLTIENAKLMREQILHLDNRSSEFREFHYAWGAIAGEEAVLHGGETRERDMASTLAGWAAKSPEAALAYFNSLEKDEQNDSGLKWGAIYGLVDADPNLAVKFAMDQQKAGDNQATRLMDLVARQVLRSGDTATAATWASSLPTGEMQNTAISRIAREYADKDPIATLTWADTLPEGEGKNRAVRESFSEWAQENPEAAADRLSTMSESPERDSATYGYATRVAREDPQAGIDWASSISNADTRNRALIETGRIFFRKDPEAAKQWLNESGLTEEQQKSVTTRRRRRG